jgi:peptidoglycan/xylan/chitin deacetylase (PgdA/CDA1 family)
MPIALIFSLDYEIFGDGSGDVTREQIDPTNKLLDVFDQHGAKLTLFLEYGQYAAYQRFEAKDNRLAEDNGNIRKQLIDVIKRGYDVQLHYHPTWCNARFENGRFDLNLNDYDLSVLPSEQIEEILKSGKDFLERLLKPVRTDYECNSFRAGSWSLQKPERFLPILRRTGFKCDSSVTPGGRLKSVHGTFDYRAAPHSFRPWPIDRELLSSALHGGVYEIPIYTLVHPLAFLKYINFRNLRTTVLRTCRYPQKACDHNLTLFGKIKKCFARNYYMADFNVMSNRTLRAMIRKAAHEIGDSRERVPVMLTGHSKATHRAEQLHDLFQSISGLPGLEYWNLGEFVSTHFSS